MTTSERQAEAVANALADGGWLRGPASVPLATRIRAAIESVPPDPACTEPVPPVPGGVWECRRSGADAWQKCATQDPREFLHGWQYRFVDPPAPPLPCPCCRSKTGPERQEDDAMVCDCGCVWFEDRFVPCPECQESRELLGHAHGDTARAVERMQAAEARCAEAARMLRDHVCSDVGEMAALMSRAIAFLEARPC